MFKRVHRSRWAAGFTAVAVTLVLTGPLGPAPAQAAAADPKNTPTEAVCEAPSKPGEMACLALVRTDVRGRMGIVPLVDPAGHGPADLQSAYNLPSATGGVGQTIAIVNAFDNPNAEADLAVYRAQYGLPPCTTANGCFRKVNQAGQPSPLPVPNAGWALETALDLDMASAICPNCNILLVEATSNLGSDLFPAVATAASMGAKFISLSWGGSEFSGQTGAESFFNHPGVAITAAAGNFGFGVSYPSSSQFVTAVGGTSLTRNTGNPRGWTETAWSDGGSGCSAFTPKPTFQADAGCARRTVVDVAAIGDPSTGVAVYNTFQDDGWTVVGGTSTATPIVASTYALAGAPQANTAANSYPYATPNALNDVTSGSNGSCTPAYLCNAGTGYDGPTGLGTPNGTRAFAPAGPHGTIAGRVTDAANGNPVVGAAVSAGPASTVTDSAGRYSLGVEVGTYDVSASAFGYATRTVTGVVVTDQATTTADIALTSVPRTTISGLVRDGSGHGWPLYARITVDGVPGGPRFTDPETGRYELELPTNATYTLRISAEYPGYLAATETVVLGTADVVRDVSLRVEPNGCTAPGYRIQINGLQEAFEATTTPPGWSVINHTPSGGWVFQDLGNRGNLTGGSGGFAIIDSDQLGSGNTQDTEMRTPVLDLTGVAAPSIGFNSDFRGFSNSFGDLDLSLDGGTTWTTLQHNVNSARGPRFEQVALPQAANQAAVQIRWRYVGTWAWWWEVDNVFVGERLCVPIRGGLVVGRVTDANTGLAINGATVRSDDRPAESAVTAPTPGDPFLGDGFYWMFSSLTGSHPFSASRSRYVTNTKNVNVLVNSARRVDFALGAGRIVVNPTAIEREIRMGNSVNVTLNVRNNGAAPANVTLGERDAGFEMMRQFGPGAALQRIPGQYSPHRIGKLPKEMAAGLTPQPMAEPWTNIADFPSPVMDNAVATNDGKVYSVGGVDGSNVLASGAVFDAAAGAWSPIADMSVAREKPVSAFVDDKLYVVGGWDDNGVPSTVLEIYNPATNTWSLGQSAPAAFAASAVAVLGGRIYVVGGCDFDICGFTDVWVYDPGSDSWSAAADYPTATSWAACGALAGQVYCTGGATDASELTDGFAYNPTANAWSPIADLPIDLWGMGYTAANGLLLVSSGITSGSTVITNQGFAYDPVTDSWTALPNNNRAVFRGGAACGFYKVGGSIGGFNAVRSSEVLPGFDDCVGDGDVTWLSETPTTFTVAPGARVQVTVTLDAAAAVVTQPGDYMAQLTVTTNTPYVVAPVPVTMTATPPRTWGKIAGTVRGAGCAGTVPLPGATVQIDTWAAHYTLFTDANGNYGLWLDRRNNPLTLIVAKDGWAPQTKKVRITAGEVTTVDWTLLPARPC
jgi:N-acetylneuraminic acid mutarotase